MITPDFALNNLQRFISHKTKQIRSNTWNHLTVCKTMSLSSFKKLFTNHIFLICTNKFGIE